MCGHSSSLAAGNFGVNFAFVLTPKTAVKSSRRIFSTIPNSLHGSKDVDLNSVNTTWRAYPVEDNKGAPYL